MNLAELDANYFTAAQLHCQDFAALAEKGIKSIINFRPDGEADDQPANAQLQEAAEEAGLNYSHVPIAAQMLTQEERAHSRHAFRTLSTPICGFCRSGARAAFAWGLEGTHGYSEGEILELVAAAGLPTDALKSQLHDDSAMQAVS